MQRLRSLSLSLSLNVCVPVCETDISNLLRADVDDFFYVDSWYSKQNEKLFEAVSFTVTLAGRCRPSSVQSLRPGRSDVRTSILVYCVLCTVDLLPTRLRHFLVVATCDRLTVVIWTSHVWNLLRTEDVHLHTPAIQIGTQFLLTLETIVFLFHLLSATSKPFSSLSTRLAHAARLGFFLQKRAI